VLVCVDGSAEGVIRSARTARFQSFDQGCDCQAVIQRFFRRLFAKRKDTIVTLLQLMLIPSAAAGVVLFACVVVQRVRREW